MARKKADKAREPAKDLEPAKDPPNLWPVTLGGETKARAFARIEVNPTVKAAEAIVRLNKPLFKDENLSTHEVANVLQEQINKAKAGDLSFADAMLVAQAATLDALFGQLARRSAANMEAGFLGASLGYMQLALKAQSNARATWETLSKIHNPPNFIRQANIANGPQQVNNGTRTGGEANTPNELNGEAHAVDA